MSRRSGKPPSLNRGSRQAEHLLEPRRLNSTSWRG